MTKIKGSYKTKAVLSTVKAVLVLLFVFLVGKGIFTDQRMTEVLGRDDIVHMVSRQGQELKEKKKVALTFDDGPHHVYTEILLDGLLERDVQVTFFVTGEHAKLHPELIRRMYQEGHLVGNHTYSHMQLRTDNKQKYKEELLLTNEILKEISGEEVVFVRPPYGSWDKALEKELEMIPVLWTVDPLDWCSGSVREIVENTLPKVEEGSIILLHDYFENSVEAALQIIDSLLEQGYCFVTVEELLFA